MHLDDDQPLPTQVVVRAAKQCLDTLAGRGWLTGWSPTHSVSVDEHGWLGTTVWWELIRPGREGGEERRARVSVDRLMSTVRLSNGAEWTGPHGDEDITADALWFALTVTEMGSSFLSGKGHWGTRRRLVRSPREVFTLPWPCTDVDVTFCRADERPGWSAFGDPDPRIEAVVREALAAM